MKESLKPLPTGSGDVAEQQLSESDDEASVLPVAPNASSLRPGIVHRLDKGTTGSYYSNTTKQGHNRRPSQLKQTTLLPHNNGDNDDASILFTRASLILSPC